MNSVQFCRTSRSKRYISDNSAHENNCAMPGIYTSNYILVCISKCSIKTILQMHAHVAYMQIYILNHSQINLHGRSNLSYLLNKSRVKTFTLTHMQSLLKGFKKNMHVVLHLQGILIALKQFNKYSTQILTGFQTINEII